jgi:hypothetical protein
MINIKILNYKHYYIFFNVLLFLLMRNFFLDDERLKFLVDVTKNFVAKEIYKNLNLFIHTF